MRLQALKQRFGIIGNSEGINSALQKAVDVANTDLTVLIQGESGVGKEVFSKIIHSLSARKHNTFIAVNCGAIPEGTIDSELFGHEKGAFTGATDKRKGYFEVVDGGTIFLDEIGEMPLGTQSRLLRVLENGEFIKVGSSKSQKTNVRVVAATNVNLLEAVRNKKFRSDLYYRLSTVPIYIPPLRERKEDIYLLFRKFSVDFSEKYRIKAISLDETAKDLLINYAWPGNIRELKNIAEQISAISDERSLDAEGLLKYLPDAAPYLNRYPVLSSESRRNNDFTDRDLLYKVLFEMRQDISDLKRMLAQVLHFNNMDMPPSTAGYIPPPKSAYTNYPSYPPNTAGTGSNEKPIVLRHEDGKYIQEEFDSAVEVEEALSLKENEQRLIALALQKHKGKRKHAAEELGISERTLFRKIKEYNIKG